MARQPSTRPVVAPIQERFVAELIGTFLLTFIGGGAIVVVAMLLHNTGQLSRPSDIPLIALAHGLALFIIVSVFGRVSGAHVNPAVTLALASIRRFPWEDVFPYVLAQFLGAILGAAAILLSYGTLPLRQGALGAPTLNVNVSVWQGLVVEALGTFILVIAVIATAADERAAPGWAPLAIGMALTTAILGLGYATGAGVNPARTFGPYLLDQFLAAPADAGGFWLAYFVSYLLGPIIGGLIAAFAYQFVARLPKARD